MAGAWVGRGPRQGDSSGITQCRMPRQGRRRCCSCGKEEGRGRRLWQRKMEYSSTPTDIREGKAKRHALTKRMHPYGPASVYPLDS